MGTLAPFTPASSATQQSRNYDRIVRNQEELKLVERIRRGDTRAMERLIGFYIGYMRFKARSYFIAGGEFDDLLQEALIGFYKATNDYRPGNGATFRTFAELCVERQIITAVKGASRNKQAILSEATSFGYRVAGADGSGVELGDTLPGPRTDDPELQAISNEELGALVENLSERLSSLEAIVLRGMLAGESYEAIAQRAQTTTKAVDNAFQRVKKKVQAHLIQREA